MMNNYLPKLNECLKVVDTENLWKEEANQNTIGGIILHMSEHVNRHVERYFKASQSVYSNGIEDYFPNKGMSPSELNEYVQNIYVSWKCGMEDLIQSEDEEIDMFSFLPLSRTYGISFGAGRRSDTESNREGISVLSEWAE